MLRAKIFDFWFGLLASMFRASSQKGDEKESKRARVETILCYLLKASTQHYTVQYAWRRLGCLASFPYEKADIGGEVSTPSFLHSYAYVSFLQQYLRTF